MAPSDVTQRGSLSQVDFSELLVRLGRGGDTGVLYVTRGEHERSFHISGGRCVFATSNDPDDSLLSYLLRRVGDLLLDREETAKRLLSNKRVGTILREMGVIDEHDLGNMVESSSARSSTTRSAGPTRSTASSVVLCRPSRRSPSRRTSMPWSLGESAG